MADDLNRALKQAAIRHLSRREHTRDELRGKLRQTVQRQRARAAREGALGDDSGASQAANQARSVEQPADAEQTWAAIESVLDDLGARGLQSDARSAEVLLSARSAGWGERRLRVELQRRGVPKALAEEALAPLAGSELERARVVWQRHFGQPPETAAEAARQARYLAARGFAADVVRRLLRHPLPDDDDAAL